MPGVADEPGTQPILRREQRRRHQDQVRDQRAERVLAGVEEQEAAGDAAERADRHRQPQAAALPVEVAALRQHAADHARPQRDGVGDVGGDGRHADRGQRREGHQRPAARDRVDAAGGHPGQSDQGVLQRRGRHRGEVTGIVRRLCRKADDASAGTIAGDERADRGRVADRGVHRRGGQGQSRARRLGRDRRHARWSGHRAGRPRRPLDQQPHGAHRGHQRAGRMPGRRRSGRGLHRFDLRHPGHPPVDLGLAQPRLAHRDGHRGPEPRPVGAPVDAGRRARQGRHRLALRPRPRRDARQRARRRDRRRVGAAARHPALSRSAERVSAADPGAAGGHRRAAAPRRIHRRAAAARRRTRTSASSTAPRCGTRRGPSASGG